MGSGGRRPCLQERSFEQAQRQQDALDVQVRQIAGASGSADPLAKWADLKDEGVLTDAEFQAQKAKLLDSSKTVANDATSGNG